MKNIEQFQHQHILVLGLAKSGMATAKLLNTFGADVVVNDAKQDDGNQEAAELRQLGIEVICGGHPLSLLDRNFSLIIKNPGIPYSNPLLVRAEELSIPIWTEIELAYRISDAPIIGITGSNGKTTTTTLLYHMLNIGKKKPLIAGNIGTVACEVAAEAQSDQQIVLEASSFQLMGVETFRPHIAIWTNIYEAHIDYHGSVEAYQKAKANIGINQTADDYLIYNADQIQLEPYVQRMKSCLIPFSTKGKMAYGISADDKQIYWNGQPFVKRSIIKLPGQHNLENILAATAAALLLKCDQTAIESVLSSFTGVRHRMQFVKEVTGRTFYNDSKATNTLATISALSSFRTPTILIAGGMDRGHSYEDLRPYMKHVKAVIAIGETRERVAEFARSCQVETVCLEQDVIAATKKAYELSTEKDVILLSPASASWDQYPSFEARGDAFIQAILALS